MNVTNYYNILRDAMFYCFLNIADGNTLGLPTSAAGLSLPCFFFPASLLFLEPAVADVGDCIIIISRSYA